MVPPLERGLRIIVAGGLDYVEGASVERLRHDPCPVKPYEGDNKKDGLCHVGNVYNLCRVYKLID